jgi:hypothetical protein
MSKGRFSWGFSLKDIVYIVLILGLCFAGWQVYKDLKFEVQQTHIAYKQLSETLARAESNMVTKDELTAWAKEVGADLKKIQKDLKGLGADLKAVGETIATIEGKIEKNTNSDDSTPHDPPEQPEACVLCDIHGYTAAVQAKDVKIGEMPHARIEFDASQEAPWTLKSDEVDVKVTTVVGELEKDEPLVFYHTISMLNKSRPELSGKEYKLKITKSEFKQTTSSTKEFYWWNPKLDMTLDNGIYFRDNEVGYAAGSSLGFTFLSYGRSKTDCDWRFARVGVGVNYDKNFYVVGQPVQYNLGKSIPIISDLWVSPGVIYDGDWAVTISIGTTL